MTFMVVRRIARLSLFFLSLFLGVGILAYLVYLQGPSQIFASVFEFGFWPFVGFVGISLINFGFYSLRWQLIINRHLPKGESIPFYRMYMHRMGGYAISYLTPAAQVGGEPVRIALLSSEKNASLKQATSSVLLDIAFELSAYVVFILAGVLLAIAQGLGDANSLVIAFVGLGGLLAFLIAFFTTIARGHGFFGPLFKFLRLDRFEKLNHFGQGIVETENMMRDFLKKNPGLVSIVALLSVTVISFRVIEVFYISYFFGVDLNFAQAFLVSTLPGIALLLPVPAGVGVFEGSFAAIFGILLIPLNAVAFALIIRGRDLVFILIGTLHILQKGSRFLQNKILKPLMGKK